MANHFIFQVNPQREYRLSDALSVLGGKEKKTIWLSPKPETNIALKADDIVYFWTSRSTRPACAARLAARGKVVLPPNEPMDMPGWQQEFCVDEATGQSGRQYHSTTPRAEIEIQKWHTGGKSIDRNITDVNVILKQNDFLKKRGYYLKTIFELSEKQAQELDRLAGW